MNPWRTFLALGPRMTFLVVGLLMFSPFIFLGAYDSYLRDVYSRSGSGEVVVFGTIAAPGKIFSVTFFFGSPFFGAAVASSAVMNQTAVSLYSSDLHTGQYSATMKNGQTYYVHVEYMDPIRETSCNAGTLNLNVSSDRYRYDVFCS